MFYKLILRLEEEIRGLEADICNSPPENYAKFRELVGKRNGLLQSIDIINEITKAEDER